MVSSETLSAAMIAEHHQIDAVIEQFTVPPDVPAAEWAPHLTTALVLLRRHIYLEEEIVFPPLAHGALQMPIMVMQVEHGEMWRRMDDLDHLLAGDGLDDAPARSQVAAACSALLELLVSHNRKEEPVIYPHADADLDPAATDLAERCLATGAVPDGWAPARASG